MRRIGSKAAGLVHGQFSDQGDAEVFQQTALHCGQIPHAVFVDQAVGLGVARLGFVGELALIALDDGVLQLDKNVRGVRALGAHVHVERLRQLVFVDGVVLVQQSKDVGQALGILFSFGAGAAVGGCVHGLRFTK